MSRRHLSLLVAAFLLAASCTGSGSGPDRASRSAVSEGGTLRIGLVNFAANHYPGWVGPHGEWNYILDPQVEYPFPDVFETYRCCLLRTLFSYNGLSADRGGADAQPDLASGSPIVSSDGLTWTIRIKSGIHYAPPFADVEIVASDFIRALTRTFSQPPAAPHRAGLPYLGLNTGSYLLDFINGAAAFLKGRTAAIAGLAAPDDHTLVVKLTRPTGDLPYRLSLPDSAPIPPGAAEGHDDGYGRFLVASGPYMFEGADDLDPSQPPAQQTPVAGFVPPTYNHNGSVKSAGSITLVRNPSWDANTDPLRTAYPDRIEFDTSGNIESDVAKIIAGTLDLVLDESAPPSVVERFSSAGVADQLVEHSSGSVYYLALNLALPPFDDVHVRKAVNWVIDKEALRHLSQRRLQRPAQVFGHIAPGAVEGDLLGPYDPYATPGNRGDVARGRSEMSLSAYDRDHDGICDTPACRGIHALRRSGRVARRMADVVSRDLRSIGVALRFRVRQYAYWRPTEHVGLGVDEGWGAGFPGASDFFEPLFDSSRIGYDGGDAKLNPGLVGASPAQLAKWGYTTSSVPSVDGKIDHCFGLIGSEQVRCWAALDQFLMEQVVPWVPTVTFTNLWMFSHRVNGYSFDEFTATPALDRITLTSS